MKREPEIIGAILVLIAIIIGILVLSFAYIWIENKEALTHLTARHIMG